MLVELSKVPMLGEGDVNVIVEATIDWVFIYSIEDATLIGLPSVEMGLIEGDTDIETRD